MILNGRFLGQKVTGVQRYARELYNRMKQDVSLASPGYASSGWRGHLWEQTVLPLRCGGDFLWSPCNMGPLGYSTQAVTIHDVAVLDHKEWFSPAFAMWYGSILPALARRVRLVITVSDFSRRRLLERVAVDPDRVIAIHNGVDSHFKPASPESIQATRVALGIPGDYVLCVGSIEPRKNLARLLQAWERVQSRFKDLTLVVAGDKGKVFRHVGISTLPRSVVFTGYVPEANLAALYSGATAFVYPSLYEGFGLPILEAMACGAPVVTANNSGCAEIAAGSALLVESTRIGSIESTLLRILADSELRWSLRQKGLERASQFSWESCAAKTLSALRTAAGEM